MKFHVTVLCFFILSTINCQIVDDTNQPFNLSGSFNPLFFKNITYETSEGIHLNNEFEISFDIENSRGQNLTDLINPYDPRQGNIWGQLLKLENGSYNLIKRWPAFFMEEFMYNQPNNCDDRDQSCFSEDRVWLQVKEGKKWHFRISPDEIGSYKIHLEGIVNVGGYTKYYGFSEEIEFKVGKSDVPGKGVFISKQLISRSNGGGVAPAFSENLPYFWGAANVSTNNNVSGYGQPCSTNCYSGIVRPIVADWWTEWSSAGGSMVRAWFKSWSWELDEWGKQPGDYSAYQNRASDFDYLVNLARAQRLMIQLAITDRDDFKTTPVNDGITTHYWRDNPYRLLLDASENSPISFFTHPSAKRVFKYKLRYILARWGYAKNIFSFELINEYDQLLGSLNWQDEIAPWHNEMANYIKSFQSGTYITNSTSITTLGDRSSNLLSTDYTSPHYYSNDRHVEDQIAYLTQRQLKKFNKPIVIGETGTHSCYSGGGAQIYFHNTIWSGIFSGSFSTPMLWHWRRHHHPLWDQGYKYITPLSSFFDNLSLENINNLNFSNIGNSKNAFLESMAETYCAPSSSPEIDSYGFYLPGLGEGDSADLNYFLDGVQTTDNTKYSYLCYDK